MGDSGRQEDEFGENALKPFQRTGRVIHVLKSGTLHTPKMITSHQIQMHECKMPVASTIKNPKYRQRHKQENI